MHWSLFIVEHDIDSQFFVFFEVIPFFSVSRKFRNFENVEKVKPFFGSVPRKRIRHTLLPCVHFSEPAVGIRSCRAF